MSAVTFHYKEQLFNNEDVEMCPEKISWPFDAKIGISINAIQNYHFIYFLQCVLNNTRPYTQILHKPI